MNCLLYSLDKFTKATFYRQSQINLLKLKLLTQFSTLLEDLHFEKIKGRTLLYAELPESGRLEILHFVRKMLLNFFIAIQSWGNLKLCFTVFIWLEMKMLIKTYNDSKTYRITFQIAFGFISILYYHNKGFLISIKNS